MDHPLSATHSATVSTSAPSLSGPNANIETTDRPSSPVSKADSEDSQPQPVLGGNTNTADGAARIRLANFLSNTRTFFSRLWDYKLDVVMGVLNIAGGLLLIFLVDLPLGFMPEELMKGLPFFMIGAGSMQIAIALRRAYVDTCNMATDKYHDMAPAERGSGRDGALTGRDRNAGLNNRQGHPSIDESDENESDPRQRLTKTLPIEKNAHKNLDSVPGTKSAASSSSSDSCSSGVSASHSSGTMSSTTSDSTTANQQSPTRTLRSPLKPDLDRELTTGQGLGSLFNLNSVR